jgi:hypothetical protein
MKSIQKRTTKSRTRTVFKSVFDRSSDGIARSPLEEQRMLNDQDEARENGWPRPDFGDRHHRSEPRTNHILCRRLAVMDGEFTSEQFSQMVGLSVTAARTYLCKLRRGGFVTARRLRGRVLVYTRVQSQVSS